MATQEARLAAQDAKLAALEQQLAAAEQRMSEAEQRLAAQATAEPEVEVDLIYPEDEEVTVELPQQEQTRAEAEPEIQENPKPAVEPQAAPEPVVEQPTAEPVVEQPVAEAPKAEAPRAPQQGSLFGTPVSDIRQAVSIGDRFLFQRELFAGNAEKLQQTLTELNNLHSFDEAIALIDKFGWDKQSTTYELFLNVLRRRFQ